MRRCLILLALLQAGCFQDSELEQEKLLLMQRKQELEMVKEGIKELPNLDAEVKKLRLEKVRLEKRKIEMLKR